MEACIPEKAERSLVDETRARTVNKGASCASPPTDFYCYVAGKVHQDPPPPPFQSLFFIIILLLLS